MTFYDVVSADGGDGGVALARAISIDIDISVLHSVFEVKVESWSGGDVSGPFDAI